MKKLTILAGVLLLAVLILSGAAFGKDTAGQGTSSDGTASQDAAGQDQNATPQGVSTDGTAGQEESGEAAGQDAAGHGITSEDSAIGEHGGINGGDAARQTTENAYGQGKVNINTASKSDLMLVPGMTRTLADNILQYRNSNGPFNTVDDLANVQGIDRKKLDEIRYYTKIKGLTDIQPDLIRSEQSAPFPDYAPGSSGSPNK